MLLKNELKALVRKTYEIRKRRLAQHYKMTNRMKKKGGIVFIGDSITEFMPVRLFFGKRAFNRGIAGETSDQTLKRYESNCLKLKPEVIVLLVGTNDYHQPADGHTAENIRVMAEKTREQCPESKLYVVSILPINEEILLPPFRREQAFMDKTNAEIDEALKDCPEVLRLDYAAVLKDEEGRLSEKYTKDGLHPNKEGYLKIKEVLLSVLPQHLLG